MARREFFRFRRITTRRASFYQQRDVAPDRKNTGDGAPGRLRVVPIRAASIRFSWPGELPAARLHQEPIARGFDPEVLRGGTVAILAQSQYPLIDRRKPIFSISGTYPRTRLS